jgi:DNA-binding response OmpR family regulator
MASERQMSRARQHILVVDHEPARRESIERILVDDGFALTTATEGLSALRILQRQAFPLIVAALDLPGALDGLTTVRRARRRRPALRALFTADFLPARCWDNPDSDDFIAAPFHRRELLGCVLELLQRDNLPGAADLARRCRSERRAS